MIFGIRGRFARRLFNYLFVVLYRCMGSGGQVSFIRVWAPGGLLCTV